jgi:hypothetical protein
MNRHILVVEDQEDNRQILRDLLGSAGYELTEAENGEEAIAAVCFTPQSGHAPACSTCPLSARGGHPSARNVPTAWAEAYYANWHEWSASEQN